ncbi:biotin--[acetyl-CoA-carboxylase] ligase [Cyanobium sp. CH-040]|uniref:biotin--[acetyl-CoA-carboxylase] ligase n=1 Tax=Cyanobium sp. CH-040 TaxID=2823708 RepID=UPI0020CB82BE|nr:biotin--[acetyl-CoA-carboxylase] ligase [Cyanobium sp. CH-040]
MCASTEIELERWLGRRGGGPSAGEPPLAVVARRQRHGRGQLGRHWHSPAGGVWLSAAMPWPDRPSAALGLAVVVGLALELEALGVEPRIKWPNDLLLEGRKLAGVLPRLRLRGGAVRWAQVGIGINGVNRAPAGAIALAEALGGAGRFHPQARPRPLERRLLRALDWACRHASCGESVRRLAEARLLPSPEGLLHHGAVWQVEGLAVDGGLRLRRGPLSTRLQRRF